MANLVTERPRLVLGIWLVLIAVLALRGLGVQDRLGTPPIYIPGTATNEEHEIELDAFGDEDALVVMLRGPRAALEREGRQLDHDLDAVPRTRVTSPWRPGGTIKGLRPKPGVAVVMVSVGRLPGQQYPDVVPPIQRQVDKTIQAPVRADISGTPLVVNSVRGAAKDASEAGEKIAMPVLMIVLLLVFRSVIAAAIPAIVGGTLLLASRGVLDLLLGTVQLDVLAVGLAAMMGLGLGVDYSLLMVSRFREEMLVDDDVGRAVRVTVTTTGRSVILAGAALLLTMTAAAQLLPGAIVVSAAVSIITASILSVLSAIFIVPAILTVVGHDLERWSLRRREDSEDVASSWSRRLTSRPALATILITFLLLAGTAHAFALDTGPATAGLLPTHDRGRLQSEAVTRELGPGWGGPFQIVVDGGDAPVTTPSRLRALAAFQRRIERDPGTQTMAGIAPIARSVQPLGSIGRQLDGFQQRVDKGRHDLARLNHGVGRARGGAARLSQGLVDARDGADRLRAATGQTRTGAGNIANGLSSAMGGSNELATGLDRARTGGDRLQRGAQKASSGAHDLQHGLTRARAAASSVTNSSSVLENDLRAGSDALDALDAPLDTTESQLTNAWQALRRMTTGRDDPQFNAALQAVGQASTAVTGTDPATGEQPDPDYGGIRAGIKDAAGQFSLGLYLTSRMRKSGNEASEGIGKLSDGAEKLDQGLARLASGSDDVAGGINRLWNGSNKLAPGLAALHDGSQRLAGGLGSVESGAGRLAGGLDDGARGSSKVASGLGRIQDSVRRQQATVGKGGPGVKRLKRSSPNLFRSGYFYLAGIDGTDPSRRSTAGLVVSVNNGGRAARMLVIPTSRPLSDGTRAMRERLEGYSADLARQTGTHVVVGGPATGLIDYDEVMRGRVPLVVILLSLITVLVLIPVLRSLLLPIVAAALNVVTVGAAFGLLALLFDNSFLGGPGYVDTIGVGTIVTVIFGLSIDYEVFVLARIREEYVRTGDPDLAITNGIGHTARVVTGAAVIMIAVFVSFAISPFISVRDFGVGLAIAVFIDAFLVRLIALPALMRLMGKWSWWLPAWLDRLLPQWDPHSSGAAQPPKPVPAATTAPAADTGQSAGWFW